MRASRPEIDPDLRMEMVRSYTNRGWRVVLLYGIDPANGECECTREGCSSPGKHPRFAGWQAKATANPERIEGLLRKHPLSNIGLAAGRDMGVVIDLDPRHGSEQSLRQLERVHGPLPDTLTAGTGGGGQHLVYAWPEGLWVGNMVPALKPYAGHAGGIDVRGQGGFVVVAPSVHVSGGVYTWCDPLDTPLAPLPDWLLAGLAVDDLLARPDRVTPYGWAALISECAVVTHAAEGSRHNTVVDSSCRIGSLVGGGEIDFATASDRLEQAAHQQDSPLDDTDINMAIHDGLQHGMKSPRTAPPGFTGRDDAMASLAVIAEVIRRKRWRGHRGKRMYEVLSAHARIATRAGGPGNYWASERTVAQEMGTSNRKRVRQGQQDCIDDGWLTLVRETYGDHGRSWRIKLPFDLLQTDPMSTPALSYVRNGVGTQHLPVAIGNDAFRDKRFTTGTTHQDLKMPTWWKYFQGLGKTCYRICDALWMADAPLTRADLARALGVNPSTITRNVPRLVEVGLVTDIDGRLTLEELSMEIMAEVALRLGTAGAALENREDYGWDNPVRREDLTAVEAASLLLPETEPNPTPPQPRTTRQDDTEPLPSAVESEPNTVRTE